MSELMPISQAMQDSITPSTESNSTKNNLIVFSNDERIAGLPETPAPVICEYCGKERYTEGFIMPFSNPPRILWFPSGAKSCTCPDGIAEYERLKEERKDQKLAKEKAEADRKMRERVREIIGESGMGERFLHRTFHTFTAETDDQRKIKAAAQQYAKSFDSFLPKRGEPLPGRNGLLISGTKGTGKTHIAMSIANDLMSRGVATICMTERNLFGRIRSTYNSDGKTDESIVRRMYETIPLLIIDDLGKEKATEWTLATLYAIIDGRYDRAMPLIITTNYDADILAERLTPKGEDKTTADAIIDRLNEMCKSIVMNGDSWRGR